MTATVEQRAAGTHRSAQLPERGPISIHVPSEAPFLPGTSTTELKNYPFGAGLLMERRRHRTAGNRGIRIVPSISPWRISSARSRASASDLNCSFNIGKSDVPDSTSTNHRSRPRNVRIIFGNEFGPSKELGRSLRRWIRKVSPFASMVLNSRQTSIFESMCGGHLENNLDRRNARSDRSVPGRPNYPTLRVSPEILRARERMTKRLAPLSEALTSIPSRCARPVPL